MSTLVSQSVVDAQWTQILVHNRDPFSLVSTVGGAWTIMIGAAAAGHFTFLMLVELRTGAQQAIDGARGTMAAPPEAESKTDLYQA